MSLPASLVAAVERHTCFTGCFRNESPVEICVDATKALAPVIQVSCGDCLSYHVGALASTLPSGMTAYSLADALTAHMRSLRAYAWTISGYHAVGSGFWLSAASYTGGLFLVDGSRNRGNQSDVELLIEAFKHQLAKPDDPGMLDPSLYTAETIHIDLSVPIGPVLQKQDILTSPQCSVMPRRGARRVTLVTFQPVAVAAAPSAPASAPPPSTPEAPRQLALGDTCPTCGAAFIERPLFSGTFVGCMC
jgi:hypothetical protein